MVVLCLPRTPIVRHSAPTANLRDVRQRDSLALCSWVGKRSFVCVVFSRCVRFFCQKDFPLSILLFWGRIGMPLRPPFGVSLLNVLLLHHACNITVPCHARNCLCQLGRRTSLVQPLRSSSNSRHVCAAPALRGRYNTEH